MAEAGASLGSSTARRVSVWSDGRRKTAPCHAPVLTRSREGAKFAAGMVTAYFLVASRLACATRVTLLMRWTVPASPRTAQYAGPAVLASALR